MTKRTIQGGLEIRFDGMDFTGKSTQAELLYDKLNEDYDVISIREPGSTRVGEKIREILLSRDCELDEVTELLLFNAARRDIYRRLVIPQRSRGGIIISDRGHDSTLAYQGYGGGGDRRLIDQLASVAMGGLKPDVTFIFDLIFEERVKRKEALNIDVDRIEARDKEYQERVANGFREIARASSSRCYLIDARDTSENIHEEIYNRVLDLLNE